MEPQEKIVFISHASADKPRIKFITDYLIKRNADPSETKKFSLFIDKPIEMGYDLDKIKLHKIRSLNDNIETVEWTSGILDNCGSCSYMIGIISGNLTPESQVWQNELVIGKARKRLLLCKIEKFEREELGSLVDRSQTIDLSDNLNEQQKREYLAIIYDKIIDTCFRESTSDSLFDAPPLNYREIAKRLPLVIARQDHRSAVRTAAAEVRKQGSLCPTIIVGPENELTERLLETLDLEHMLGSTNQEQDSFVIRAIDWPNTGREFVATYRLKLGKQMCGDEQAVDGAIATALGRIGHNVVLMSTVYSDEPRNFAAEVAAWVEYWTAWVGDPMTRNGIAPVLLIVLPKASVGWDNEEPRVPPLAKQDRVQHLANCTLIDQLTGIALAVSPKLKLIRPPLTPVRKGDFRRWVNAIDDRVLDGDQKQALRDQFQDDYFEATDAHSGVNLKPLHKDVVAWFAANAQSAGV